MFLVVLWYTQIVFSLLLSCPEYDAWEGNKYTIDVNCRPFIMVHGLIVLMVLDTIKIHTMAQDMTVPGWMGWLNVKESSKVTWLKALFHSATLNLINKECSRVDDDSLCVEEKINDYEWGCKGTCSNVWTKGGKVGLLVQKCTKLLLIAPKKVPFHINFLEMTGCQASLYFYGSESKTFLQL